MKFLCKLEIRSNIEPEDANNKEILFKSDNPEIATIDEYGNINAKQTGTTTITASSKENSEIKAECKLTVGRKLEDFEIHFDSSLQVNSNQITGIDYTNNTVLNIKNLITTDFDIEIVNNKNEVIEDLELVGTGSKIRVLENSNLLTEYEIILYGDANGDGKINSVDLLVLQRHILEIEPLKEIYRKATNINKNGNKPTSVDLLLIQRHILGLQIIEQ